MNPIRILTPSKWISFAATFAVALTLVQPAHAAGAASRDNALAVFRAGSPAEIVHVVSGAVPSHAEEAVTLSDANCDPDAKGISHCLNALKLSDGQTIVVRHDHDMRYMPCLAPGEKVEVKPGKN